MVFIFSNISKMPFFKIYLTNFLGKKYTKVSQKSIAMISKISRNIMLFIYLINTKNFKNISWKHTIIISFSPSFIKNKKIHSRVCSFPPNFRLNLEIAELKYLTRFIQYLASGLLLATLIFCTLKQSCTKWFQGSKELHNV